MKTPSINATIRHLGVKLNAARCGSKLLGYSYFVSLKTGNQIGESVMVYRQNQLSLDRWLAEAKSAIASHVKSHGDYDLTGEPAPLTYAGVARSMAQQFPDFDWDSWKDDMKDRMTDDKS